jgi:hypothetical protein
MYETISISEINRNALISFLAAVFALLALCMGLLPIPFTVIVCYPPGIVLGIVSLAYGVIALREIREGGKRGEGWRWPQFGQADSCSLPRSA